jgi:hypothetical protein
MIVVGNFVQREPMARGRWFQPGAAASDLGAVGEFGRVSAASIAILIRIL